jgi:hypothetical protein
MAKRDWTQEELRQLLQEYEANNPDPRVFAKDKQVGLSTLYKLLARAKVARPQMRQAEEIRFVEVVPPKKTLISGRPEGKTEVTLEMPAVGTLRFGSLPPAEYLGTLIATLARGRRTQPC